MIIAYARVSTTTQNLDSQLNALNHYGCDIIYTEKGSGRNPKRSVLQTALNALEPGDTFVIFKLDRLSRGTRHLLNLMEEFEQKQIHFISIENNIDTSHSMGRFFFTIMSAFAEMEAELIRERVLSGLSAARENGKTLGRPIADCQMEKVVVLYVEKQMTISAIAREMKISRPTVYHYLRKKGVPLRTTHS
ncbi:recombinase family protein [Listeria fleischmannii]|uniref:Recombinase family protein n=1 Tax=Listeria fleischmannii TaxID=1069827 RepID=A0A841YIC4_9LIST|nr:recombinase family protein [Listeria fleischmannii]EIA18887.1 resolvase family protein [Listeria fleischmannii subsp. coloradonensis]MBC1399798.1 recombinase family protein [Listeria fleischmannii]MBC1428107.1 recombinase family protein [Listeria fleischmannii]STY35006.1 DNA-invertase hin [Listeria fleischmannii subsp. coloradonensis]